VCRASSWLEIALFSFCLALLLAGLVFALPIPFAKDDRLPVNLDSAAAAMFRRMRVHGVASDSAIEAQWTANEFAFERAVEAYEELIDSTCGRRSDARSCIDPRS
jgi:hypothetical protein